MEREEIKKYLLNNYNLEEKANTICQLLKFKATKIYNSIFEVTDYLNEKRKFNERLYHIVHDLYGIPKCKMCDKNVTFVSLVKGYQAYCSVKCSSNDKEVILKREKTYLKKTDGKYKNAFQDPDVKNKIQKHWDNIKPGATNPSQIDYIQENKKETNKKLYGREYYFQTDDFKIKNKRYWMGKLDVSSPMKNIDFINYRKEKYEKENGVSNPNKLKSTRLKIKKTNIERYGHEATFCDKNIQKLALEKSLINKRNKFINKLSKIKNIELIEYDKIKNKYIFKCKKCNKNFEIYHQFLSVKIETGEDFICPECKPELFHQSSGEQELHIFLRDELKLDILHNDRKIISPKELDFFIPSYNIAIEYNGLYWHSESNGKYEKYHLEKTLECKNKSIRLIHIFEDEWIFKKDIVKMRLRYLFNKLKEDNKRIHARECIIKEISIKEKNEFLNKYHIQGQDKSNIKLGAFYKNELVSVMTFAYGNISKGSIKKEDIFELSRFSSNYNYHIPGIASKLLEYFKKNYKWKELFTYADLRWNNGEVYPKLGFIFEKQTKPNYWYIKGFNRIHRFNLKKTDKDDKNLSEHAIRLKEGYFRIWDCGNLKFKLVNENY